MGVCVCVEHQGLMERYIKQFKIKKVFFFYINQVILAKVYENEQYFHFSTCSENTQGAKGQSHRCNSESCSIRLF